VAPQRVRAEPGQQAHFGAIHSAKFANLLKFYSHAQKRPCEIFSDISGMQTLSVLQWVVHGRGNGPCTRPCTGRVLGRLHTPYTAVYTAYSRQCTRRVHGCVRESCPRPCTRPCTRPCALHSRVHERVSGRYTAVYTKQQLIS